MQVQITDIGFENLDFWNFYFQTSFYEIYDQETEISVSEKIEESMPLSQEWTDTFTQYFDGVIEEFDGYIENPTTLSVFLEKDKILKIEFHPGDTIFYINNKQIGCIGPHTISQCYPYKQLQDLLHNPDGEILFLLLFPIVELQKSEQKQATEQFACLLQNIFSTEVSQWVADCVCTNITTE